MTCTRFFVIVVFASSSVGCAVTQNVARDPGPPAASAPATVSALRYRRLAWSPEMRSRDWLDEIYVPSMHVAFNLETEIDSGSPTIEFFPKLNAFFADEPVGYSEDVHGGKPAKLGLTEVEIPADLADAVREQARIAKALTDSARALGSKVDAAHVLPLVVGSPEWKPPKQE